MADDIAGDGSLRGPEHRLPQLLGIALKNQTLVDNNLVCFPIFRVYLFKKNLSGFFELYNLAVKSRIKMSS